jgi:hypothetical protein
LNDRYLVFDLETELIQGALDLDRHVPRITVAAALTGDGELRTWYERDQDGRATGDLLTRETAQALVSDLLDMDQAGRTIVTWNGAGFDFRVLAHASGMVDACARLAWEHVDMMFWFHCQQGFAIQLAKAAEAVGTGKTQGLSGADAPRLWVAGEYERVIAYVAQDVRATAAVYEAALRNGGICWTTSYGRVSKAAGKLLPVREAFQLPLPDTSWMRRPAWPRTKFVGWFRGARSE